MAGKLSLAALFLAVLALTGTAAADNGWAGFPGGVGCASWGWNFPYGLPANSRERIPHFALYPPVYYSLPIARTYGYSPFAYPPGYSTPEIEAGPPGPLTVPNRFVPQPPAKKSSLNRVTQAPLRIINPYVVPEEFGGQPTQTVANSR